MRAQILSVGVLKEPCLNKTFQLFSNMRYSLGLSAREECKFKQQMDECMAL